MLDLEKLGIESKTGIRPYLKKVVSLGALAFVRVGLKE